MVIALWARKRGSYDGVIAVGPEPVVAICKQHVIREIRAGLGPK